MEIKLIAENEKYPFVGVREELNKATQKVYIVAVTTRTDGVIIETNIPAKLKPDRMPSIKTFVSWDKIGE